MNAEAGPNSGRKLFFGLFIFPLVIAVGMAVLLCSAVLLTHEEQTPETLIAAIKTGSPGRRWQKAFELSNELNARKTGLRDDGVMREIIAILANPDRYDPKTRSYMALALSHFDKPESIAALRRSLAPNDPEVTLYILWALGRLRAAQAAPEVAGFLQSDEAETRTMAAYVLGVIGNAKAVPALEMLLNDPVMDVRRNAALALARLGNASGLEVLEKMMQRSDLASENLSENQIEAIMVNAGKGLALIPNPKSIRILEAVAREDKNLKVRQAALDALAHLRKTDAG